MTRDRSVTHPLGNLTTQDFLNQYWGQQPFHAQQAFAGLEALIDADELAGAACEPGVDARLITGSDAQLDWRAEFGPFPESRFANLGADNWTLLVQAVDTWSPSVAGLMDAFEFLPRWSLDDVMVSYSTPGGGVGPHFDNYDVFLIQASGRRLWRTGQRCSADTLMRTDSNLRLLEQFDEQGRYETGPGDVLYVPAGLAHWGTALTDECITCSVGFRAPSHAEVLQQAAEFLVEDMTDDQRINVGSEGSASDAMEIGEALLGRLLALQSALSAGELNTALVRAFGALVTQPHEHVLDVEDEVSVMRIPVPGDTGKTLLLSPRARTAYVRTASGADLFVDGEVTATSLAFARDVCRRQKTRNGAPEDPSGASSG